MQAVLLAAVAWLTRKYAMPHCNVPHLLGSKLYLVAKRTTTGNLSLS
jgi:hypothetical protein